MKSHLKQPSLDQVRREIERMHRESLRDIRRAVAALRTIGGGENELSVDLKR